MAFPSTSVLDSFTRANENPLAGGWLGPQYVGDAQFQIVSDQAKPGASASDSYLHSAGIISAPLEVFFTVVTPDTAAGGFSRIDYCIQNPNTSNITAYRVSNGYGASLDLVRLERHDVGGTTNYTAFTSTNFWSAGSVVGVRLLADGTHQIYRNGTLITTFTDTTYTSGYLGMTASVNAIHDDFGGGSAAVVNTASPSGTITLSGSNLVSVTVPAGTGSLSLSGTESSAYSRSVSLSGVVALSGSLSVLLKKTISPSGTIQVNGASTSKLTPGGSSFDAGHISGEITLGGSVDLSFLGMGWGLVDNSSPVSRYERKAAGAPPVEDKPIHPEDQLAYGSRVTGEPLARTASRAAGGKATAITEPDEALVVTWREEFDQTP